MRDTPPTYTTAQQEKDTQIVDMECSTTSLPEGGSGLSAGHSPHSPHSPYSTRSTGSALSSSSTPKPDSRIATAYRQAAQLFLTHRLPEALSTIKPIITAGRGVGPRLEEDIEGAVSSIADATATAPVSRASRGTRIKVWSFYLTFLNAVVELGPEEGKNAFGAEEWKGLVAKTRDGSVWEHIVCAGYAGHEGRVDPEVVINLSTLLLTHSPTQELNQDRLEAYIVSSAVFTGISSPSSSSSSSRNRHSTTQLTNPRDITTKLRIIELYTLHVLPRNNGWDQSRHFIDRCSLLDEEQQGAFMMALDTLKVEIDQSRKLEEELVLKQGREMAEAGRRQEREREREREKEREREGKIRRSGGMGRTDVRSHHSRSQRPEPTSRPETSNPHSLSRPIPPSSSSATPTASPHLLQSLTSSVQHMLHRISGLENTSSSSPRSASRSVSRKDGSIFPSFNAGSLLSLRSFRYLFFLLVLLLALGKREIREKVKQALVLGWGKVKGTVGMGVRVSYV